MIFISGKWDCALTRMIISNFTNNFCQFPSWPNYSTSKDQKVFSNLKTRTLLFKNSGLIYRIPRLDCPDTYVGETNAHKSDINHPDIESTAFADHSKKVSHSINFEEISIIAREDNDGRRKIREILRIIKEKNSANFKSDSRNIKVF